MADKMQCPNCGVDMNHHADKLVEATGAAEASAIDKVLGGFVEQVYSCPDCGHAESRRAVTG